MRHGGGLEMRYERRSASEARRLFGLCERGRCGGQCGSHARPDGDRASGPRTTFPLPARGTSRLPGNPRPHTGGIRTPSAAPSKRSRAHGLSAAARSRRSRPRGCAPPDVRLRARLVQRGIHATSGRRSSSHRLDMDRGAGRSTLWAPAERRRHGVSRNDPDWVPDLGGLGRHPAADREPRIAASRPPAPLSSELVRGDRLIALPYRAPHTAASGPTSTIRRG